jgi:ankyrin repeat protein
MRVQPGHLIACGIALLLSVAPVGAATDSRLIQAVRDGNVEAVRALIKQNVNVNTPQADGATALHWAAYQDDLTMADVLIAAKAAVNAANQLGVTPLYLACENGSALMVGKLLKAGASPNVALPSGETLLMTAARAGSASVVRALLAAGADVSAREKMQSQTALMWAVSEQRSDVVQALIEGGADLRARSRIRKEVVDMGGEEEAGNETTEGTIIDEGGFTPLLFAARTGNVDAARMLLEAGVDVNETKPDGASALVVAAHSAQEKVALFLLEKGADPNAAGAGYTALHAAVLRSLPQLVDALIARGANVNAPLVKGTVIRRQSKLFSLDASLKGATPFFLASKFNEPLLMSALVKAGANPLTGLPDGTTPLMVAAGMRTSGLGRTGRDRRDRELDTADNDLALRENKDLRTWVESGIEAVKLTVELGNDVNAANVNGDTALHSAAFHGFDSNIKFLVEKGANINAKNKKGQTPLAVALSRRNADDKTIATTTADLLRSLGGE